MKYQVPQFIDTENKIIGPFTFTQFMYLLAGAVVLFVVKSFVSIGNLYIIAIPVAAASFSLAFVKIDGIPLPKYILLALNFSIGNKTYTYHKDQDNEYLKSLLDTKSQP